MPDDGEAWERIGQALRQRMLERSMSQADLIRASGVSDMTIRPILNGEAGTRRPATLAKIAQALGWRADAFQQMLNGVDPEDVATPAREATDADTTADLSSLSAEGRAAVRAIIAEMQTRQR